MRNGTLGLINQYGTGVADDKLAHAYAEAMIRFYLGEEPVIRSVPTFDLAQPDQLERALDQFEDLVIKPRAGHGGVGVVIAPHASKEDVAGGAPGGRAAARRLDRPAAGHAFDPSVGLRAASSRRATSTCARSSSWARAASRACSRAASPASPATRAR